MQENTETSDFVVDQSTKGQEPTCSLSKSSSPDVGRLGNITSANCNKVHAPSISQVPSLSSVVELHLVRKLLRTMVLESLTYLWTALNFAFWVKRSEILNPKPRQQQIVVQRSSFMPGPEHSRIIDASIFPLVPVRFGSFRIVCVSIGGGRHCLNNKLIGHGPCNLIPLHQCSSRDHW